MSDKAWGRLGYFAIATIVFICTISGVKVAIDLITWSALDSGWAQAVGSVAAILGAFAIARYEARGADRQRQRDRFERDIEQAFVCMWIANDILGCFRHMESVIENRLQGPGRAIGTERLQQLQQNLLTFASRDLHPSLMGELIFLQREVAYAQTAAIELGRNKASETRFDNARKRTQRVLECKDRLDTRLIAFRKRLKDAEV